MVKPLFLVVDDEPLFVRSVLDTVAAADLGLRCLGVSNGAEALDLIEKEEVAVLLTDLKMPVMDGYHLLAELVSRGFQAPIIIATAFGSPEMEVRLQVLNGVRYLEKPADLDHLLELLAEVLESSPSRGLNLKGLVQILAAAARPVVAQIRSGQKLGRLTIKKHGVHARAGQLKGDAAAQEILSWPHPVIQLQPNQADTIPIGSVEKLLKQISSSVTSEPNEARATAVRTREAQESEMDNLDNDNKKRKMIMNVKEAISSAMAIDGAVGTALVNHESGMTLGSEGTAIDIELAASGNTEVVRSKMAVMRSLGLKDEIEDILITLDTQFHIIRPLKKARDLFLYLAIDRKKGNLGLARHQLTSIEKDLEL